MKQLFLIRHGKSSWSNASLSDLDRPLNKRGHRQLEAMARPLRMMGALDGQVHVSQACRARQTIEGLLDLLGEPRLVARIHFEPDLYTFRYKRLLHWIRQLPEDPETLTIIGHNPALSDLAARLTGQDAPDMATGSVMHLELPIDSWARAGKGQSRVVAYLPPKLASYKLFQRKAPPPPHKEQDLRKQVPATLHHLLERMRAIQPGVLAGVDPEFLHQFRIALRQSRAITEAICTTTGDEHLKKALHPLKTMARQTSIVRDLDVFLMELDARTMEDRRLRQSLRASGAEAFFRHWQTECQQQLCSQLEGKGWRKALATWEAAVTGKTLSRPLKKLTPSTIHNTVSERAALCQQLFAHLAPDAPDERFHDVRKALKRLRYLAELDTQGYQDLINTLKRQQKLYGRFQDRHVQLTLLDTLADNRRDRQLPPALAELAAELEREKQEARARILTSPNLELA
ncbi:CHAD domain-containing protein [Marinobacter bryozoorum]|uniref:CHAD domain-containing protein n=1 Tax=Marinobacter bryozoorum TaxID=256324 RepID=UPI0020043D23|nr:CHAD domain-containing protein [Marinobacter bryozoorum]MCK7544933.1 CHAD domain-containing protein [Marinobacter bryozoorum]